MRVTNHNWSATKQCLHLQSVAQISHRSVLSGRQVETIESIDVKAVNMLMLFYHYVKLVSVNTCMKHVFLQEDEDGGKKYTSHMLEQLHLYTVD